METIREYRISHGLTQQAVCDIVGMPLRTLQDWEYGKRTPPEWVLKLVLEKLEREVE